MVLLSSAAACWQSVRLPHVGPQLSCDHLIFVVNVLVDDVGKIVYNDDVLNEGRCL